MKNRITSFVLAGALIGFLPTILVFTQTGASAQDEQVAIEQLQAQINLLKARLTELQTKTSGAELKLKLTRTLHRGNSGNDVKLLQEFFGTLPGIYPEQIVSGYFGPLTEAAVKRFQKENGIEQLGIVGPKTAAKINELEAIASTPASPSSSPIPSAPTSPSPSPMASATPSPSPSPSPSSSPSPTPGAISPQVIDFGAYSLADGRTDIGIGFNENIATSGSATAYIYSTNYPSLHLDSTIQISQANFNLITTTGLSVNKNYTIVVPASAISDLSGNHPMSADYSCAFTWTGYFQNNCPSNLSPTPYPSPY